MSMNILVTKPSLWYLKVFDMYLIFGLGSFIFFGGHSLLWGFGLLVALLGCEASQDFSASLRAPCPYDGVGTLG